MHELNRCLWSAWSEKYRMFFHGTPRVLEVGSQNVNGSIRTHFSNIHTYIGVDWRPGKCVDVVSLAHEMEFDDKFDTVASASMLEHDPYWDKSITKMVSLLRDNGALFLYWGGALNPPHCHETAHDGGFHALPACDVIGLLSGLGLYIHEFRYEISFGPQYDDIGGVCLVAFKDKAYAMGERVMEPLKEADTVTVRHRTPYPKPRPGRKVRPRMTRQQRRNRRK